MKEKPERWLECVGETMDPGREWQEVRKGARNTEKLPMHGPLTMGREQSERGTNSAPE